MHILITGADRPLAQAVAGHLRPHHELCLTGVGEAPEGCGGADYRQADLRSQAVVEKLVAGIDAILHLAEFDPAPLDRPDAEQAAIERATLGSYILCDEARKAGVDRVVVVSTLEVFDAYPDSYMLDEQWKPLPDPTAEHLAPHLCETVVREFVREGPIAGVGLRFAPIGNDPERHTRLADALGAIDRALEVKLGPPSYRWHVFHVASSPRFIMREARLTLGLEEQD
jgi:nucleoside-diphosphate-sugar epimerase